MKKFISYSIAIVTLTFFVILMLSGYYLKNPRNPSEDVIAYVETSINHAKAEKWDMLQQDMTNIDESWKKIIPRIQFSVQRDEIYNISLNIARLRGSISAQDKTNTLMELNSIIENWRELTR